MHTLSIPLCHGNGLHAEKGHWIDQILALHGGANTEDLDFAHDIALLAEDINQYAPADDHLSRYQEIKHWTQDKL